MFISAGKEECSREATSASQRTCQGGFLSWKLLVFMDDDFQTSSRGEDRTEKVYPRVKKGENTVL